MKYTEFGNTGEKVSVIGTGTMRIARMTDDEAMTFVTTAIDSGINFFDHADIYGGGESERVFGRLFRKDPSLRAKMFLQSKCAIHDGMFDFSKDYILHAVDGILDRLNTDHIDSLLLHRPDALMEPEEVNEAFTELHNAGKVRYFGVSNMNAMQMKLLQNALDYELCADQLQMSLAHTPMFDAGFNVNMTDAPAVMRDGGTLEYCRLKGMTVQTWSPLQVGYFQGVFLNDERYPDLNAKLDELAEKYGTGKDTIAYAWLLRYPAKMQVITGTSSPERIRSAAAAADIRLTRKEWYDLYKSAGNRLP
ncbi:MAG: aldo/keto reductase [Solobacterium sp.]|nr:aldo/keto reductase [Solobacterium sp.]